MSDPVAYTCPHGHQYSEWEMEMGMSQGTKDHCYGDEECPWPWYADDPHIIQEPEIIEL